MGRHDTFFFKNSAGVNLQNFRFQESQKHMPVHENAAETNQEMYVLHQAVLICASGFIESALRQCLILLCLFVCAHFLLLSIYTGIIKSHFCDVAAMAEKFVAFFSAQVAGVYVCPLQHQINYSTSGNLVKLVMQQYALHTSC